jgi:hypothetical protein
MRLIDLCLWFLLALALAVWDRWDITDTMKLGTVPVTLRSEPVTATLAVCPSHRRFGTGNWTLVATSNDDQRSKWRHR